MLRGCAFLGEAEDSGCTCEQRRLFLCAVAAQLTAVPMQWALAELGRETSDRLSGSRLSHLKLPKRTENKLKHQKKE